MVALIATLTLLYGGSNQELTYFHTRQKTNPQLINRNRRSHYANNVKGLALQPKSLALHYITGEERHKCLKSLALHYKFNNLKALKVWQYNAS